MNRLCSTILEILLDVISTVNGFPPSDRAALLAFKAALHEPHLGIFDSWTGTDCCHNWYGIRCDAESHKVADINLRGESQDPIFERAHRTGYMTGFISPDICKLTRLSSITIADWKGITGEIPKCITTLSFLRILDLIGNKILGETPADIGKLQRLTKKKISGLIPRKFGRLRMLSRAFEQFIGGDSSFSRENAVLSTLNLDCNNISGTIPTTLLTSSIGSLNLSRNALEGKISEDFGRRSYFTAIDLAYNKLSGSIPGTLVVAYYIGHLDLSYNHICGLIPAGEPFDHLEASSFTHNDCLSGKPHRAC
ncbi:60S ribosomal protein L31-like [Hibiscus syriacus]|uniref:60S ribosomal protein L31-like n=1 Tax=Hibiscus syriacus TaxID=106335 RepID=A0A6A3B7Q9_HIBSY|nr:60S ribosomal protein L31-like [Hibiscus syriacus]